MPAREIEVRGTCHVPAKPGEFWLAKGIRRVFLWDLGDRPIWREPRSVVLVGRVRVRVLWRIAWLFVSWCNGFGAVSGE